MESCSSRLPWLPRVAPGSRRRSFSSFSAPVRYQPNLIIFEGLFSDQLIFRRPTLQATETLGWEASWTICTRYSHTFAYLSDICSVHHRPSDLREHLPKKKMFFFRRCSLRLNCFNLLASVCTVVTTLVSAPWWAVVLSGQPGCKTCPKLWKPPFKPPYKCF